MLLVDIIYDRPSPPSRSFIGKDASCTYPTTVQQEDEEEGCPDNHADWYFLGAVGVVCCSYRFIFISNDEFIEIARNEIRTTDFPVPEIGE